MQQKRLQSGVRNAQLIIQRKNKNEVMHDETGFPCPSIKPYDIIKHQYHYC
jgi:hypothetical protein